MLHSMDDFYVTSSGLVVTETTLGNYNPALWSRLNPTNSVFMTRLRWTHDILLGNGVFNIFLYSCSLECEH